MKKTWCSHIDTLVPSVITKARRKCFEVPHVFYQNSSRYRWYCFHCESVVDRIYCDMYKHYEDYERTHHFLALTRSIFESNEAVVRCLSCEAEVDADEVIQRHLSFKDESSLSKLKNFDAMMVNVADLLVKPFPNFKSLLADAKANVDMDEIAKLAKELEEELKKILDQGFDAFAHDHVQKKFLIYSGMLLSVASCTSELMAELSSFRSNLPAFIQAKNDLMEASHLAASVTRKKVVLVQECSRYIEANKEILALQKRMVRPKDSVAEGETIKAKINAILDSIDKQVTSTRDGLVPDLSQMSALDGKIVAAKQLVSQQQIAWNRLMDMFN